MTVLARSVHAEWTKARSLPSTAWLVAFVAVVMVALSLAVTGTLRLDGCVTDCLPDTVKLSLSGVRVAQIGAVVIGIQAVSSEYASRTITPALLAVPRRASVVIGKLVVVLALTAAGAVPGVVGALVTARTVLRHHGFTPAGGFGRSTLMQDLTQRAAVGTVVYLMLVALLSAGVALVVRDAGGALVLVLSVLFLPSIISMFVSNPVWQDRLLRFSPMDAGLAIQTTRNLAALPIAAWPGLGLLCLYTVAAVVGGAVAFRLRDA